MVSAVSGCLGSGADTATDRLKQPAAAHAKALAGDDPAKMRETGMELLALMEAAFRWGSQ